MTPMVPVQPQETTRATDLVEAIRQVLTTSDEPLTPAKIKSALPAPYRAATVEELVDCLNRQVTAQVFVLYPKYRSPHDRYWDRPMRVHVAWLLRQVLQDGPLALFEVRRKLPTYAVPHAEEVLQDQLRARQVYCHPPLGKRGGERFGVTPPDVRTYLGPELLVVLEKLEALGFTVEQIRAGALEMLHDEEWAEHPPAAEGPVVGEKTWTAHPAAPTPSPHLAEQPSARTSVETSAMESL